MSKLRFITGLALSAVALGCGSQSRVEDGGPPRAPDDAREPREDTPPARPPPAPPPAPQRLQLITAEEPPPPISGGTLAVTSDGALVVAADPDRDLVYVVKLSSEEQGESLADASVVKFNPVSLDAGVKPNAGPPLVSVPPRIAEVSTVTLADGSEPGRVALDGAGYAHIVLRGRNSVARIALGTSELEQETPVCQHPRGVSYDATGDAIWVACANGELVSLSAKTHAELTRSFVALDLRDVVVTHSGERFVSRYRSAELLRIDADGNVRAKSTPRTTWALNERSHALTKSPNLAWRTTLSPDGKVYMLHQQSQNEPVNVDVPGGYGGACGSIAQPGITEFDDQGAPALTGAIPGSLAVDMAVAPGGDSMAIALPGNYLRTSSTLQVIQKGSLQGAAQSSASAESSGAPRAGTVPVEPEEGTVRRAGCRVPGMTPTEDAQVTALAFDANGLLYAFSREPAELLIYAAPGNTPFLALVQEIALNDTSVRDTGHELFHADVGGGLACASCHGEALDDGHVWTFEGFGPRRTQNMRGGFLNTLPLHWEGDMPTFQHLVDEVMTGRMSGFQVEPQFAEALATWIDRQPELTLDARDAAAAERGRELFASREVGCTDCHSGAMFTNNESADVGSGGRFQVPPLLGLALRGPYMHDGCAKTLEERFEPSCGGGDEHGKTSQLTRAQIADLAAYLESL